MEKLIRPECIKNFNTCPEQEGITRLLFADEEIMARAYVKQRMVKAGLQVTEDTIGNIYGTLVGSQPELAPVWSGSHIDTVRNAGMYDGTVGVIGALEACRMIRESNAPPQYCGAHIYIGRTNPVRHRMYRQPHNGGPFVSGADKIAL